MLSEIRQHRQWRGRDGVTTGTAARQFDGIDIEAFYEMQKLYVELGVISVDQIIHPAPITAPSLTRWP